jgi:hypothetical protein
MRNSALLFLVTLAPCFSYAFDVEGFSTAMPRAAVIALAERSYYKLVDIDADSMVANAADGGYLSFNFCEGKLVSVQQGLSANLQQVTLVFAEFNANYGNPFSTDARTRAHSSGTIYEWGTWWNAGSEFVSLYYMSRDQVEVLSTSYQSSNKCFKVPR